MKMSRIVLLFLSKVVFICNGLRVLGPSGPLTVQPGGSVMLPCYVETPIPMEELEVEWRRTDAETVVHLFQDGESRPESQDQYYHERACFFTEKVALGNFSLLLTDVTTKDTGVYKCVVYRNHEFNETLIELNMREYLTVSGGHVVSAYAGESTTLNCSVHSHIPPEQIEQLSWKKVDQDVVVLLFVQGEIQLESTHETYRDRVDLFGPEEIHKGNFSLRLKNVQTEDKGLYVCEALHDELSANTTVEVLQLGLSTMHIAVFCLCACVCLCGTSLLLVCIPWPCFKVDDHLMIKVQHGLVFCPNVLMFLAFILWGQLEGFFNEVAVFSAVNLLRILPLLHFTPLIDTFEGKAQQRIKRLPSLEFPLFCISGFSVFRHTLPAEYRTLLIVIGILTMVIYIGFGLAVARACKMSRTISISMYMLVFFFQLFIYLTFNLSLIDYWIRNAKHKMGLIFVNVYLIILTALAYVELYFTGFKKCLRKQPLGPFSRLCMCGVAVLFLVNSITLSAELILSARNGKRTIEDLELVLLPFEWIFAFGCIIAIFVMQFSKQKVENEHPAPW